jgi:hypothetical protein
MRSVLMLLAIAGLACSQAITDAAGIIGGSSVGGVAGKKVGQGVSAVFAKVGSATDKAAKTAKSGTAKPKENSRAVLQVGPGGVVKDHSLVPPPPPKKRVVSVVPPPPSLPPTPTVVRRVVVLPPPPVATPDDLKALASGTPRAEVLKLGAPASRITMVDNGHLVEIYRYQSADAAFGVVRLSDGSVSSVQVR